MLQVFQDFGKCTPEVVAGIIKVMATFPAHIQEKVVDLRFGLPSKLKFLPTIADVIEAGNQYLRAERESIDYAKRFSGKPMGREARTPFRPFPQLWNAFGEDWMDLECRRHKWKFDTLQDACRALVTQGRDAAETVLLSAPVEK